VACGGNQDLAGRALNPRGVGHHPGTVAALADLMSTVKGELRFIYHNFRVFSVALSLALSALSPFCRVPSSPAR
jgi:hypothetical protein